MRPLLAIALLIIGAIAAPAQEGTGKAVCSLSATQVPAMGGVKLRMTTEQVLALFPGSAADAEVRSGLSRPGQFGVTSFTVTPDRYQTKEKYAGISRISFTFLDGRVSTFSISYNGPEWPHVDKFVEKVVEGTELPPTEGWAASAGMEAQSKILTCTDFELRVFAGGQGGSLNYVLLNDLAAARTLKERRVKAREKAKQESKPQD